MPRKISRESSTELSRPQMESYDVEIKNSGLIAIGAGTGMLGVGLTAHAAATAYAATANLISTTVYSLAECSKAYFNYIEERQRTRQIEIWSYTVLEEARERTRQMEIQAEAMINFAREETKRVELQAESTVAQIRDTQAAREARIRFISNLMEEHSRLHQIFFNEKESGILNLPVDERVNLTRYRDQVLQRLNGLEHTITTMAAGL